MSWVVVVVHTDPAALVAGLEAAGLVVEQPGTVDNYGFTDSESSAAKANRRRGHSPATVAPARAVLVVSNPARRRHEPGRVRRR